MARWWSGSVMRLVRATIAVIGLAFPLAWAEEPATDNAVQAPSLWERDTLTGDWGGLRTTLAEHGVAAEAVYTGETWSTLSGGLHHHTRYLDNLDLTLTLDAEKLVGWKGASFFLYGLENHGGSPSEDVGDAQVVSNIDAPDSWKLYEAWFQQNLFDDRLSLLAGLYNLNGEFYVNDVAALFINSSFGIGKDFSQSGRQGPSIFPTTSLGVRLKGKPTDDTYVMAAVLDGVSGLPSNPHGTQIAFSQKDGYLLAFETGWLRGVDENSPDAPGKYALGGWFYTSRFPDLRTGRERRGSHGIYALAEQMLWRETDDPAQGLAVFARGGFAESQFNPFDWFVAGGATYTGAIPGRDADQLGFALATGFLGGAAAGAARRDGLQPASHETAIEWTYRLQVTPWFAIQPDIQYVVNPGASRSIPNALAFGTRFAITF